MDRREFIRLLGLAGAGLLLEPKRFIFDVGAGLYKPRAPGGFGWEWVNRSSRSPGWRQAETDGVLIEPGYFSNIPASIGSLPGVKWRKAGDVGS